MDFPVELPEKHRKLAEQLRIQPDEITERFTRGSGPGGQKINTTENCVELRHAPTGIRVRIQRYRERSANRLSAYKRLIERIDERKRGAESEQAKKRHRMRKQKKRRSRRTKEKMLEEKKRRGQRKELRKKIL